ncbi:MAG: hypothetical protein DWQ01_22535 [Planctomycetota bacterium]|nr:MAG: hypothetical protein DWQ01_22535 [Planctomycetota bacterium]
MNPRKFLTPLPLLFLVTLTPTGLAQDDFVFHQSAFDSPYWADGTSNLGDFSRVRTEFDGIFQVRFFPGGGVFDQAQILGGHCYDNSGQIVLEVPNPSGSPFLTVTLTDMVFDLNTQIFDLDPGTGEFEDIDIERAFLHGTALVEEPGQSPVLIELDSLSIPTFHLRDQGHIDYYSGAPDLIFEVPIEIEIPIQTPTVTANILLRGSNFGSNLHNTPQPLLTVSSVQAGMVSIATVKSAAPNSVTWLGFSKAGLGSEFIPQLGFHVDLIAPEQAGQAKMTNNTGGVSWTITVPPGLLGDTLWIQAVQLSGKTNVVIDTVK